MVLFHILGVFCGSVSQFWNLKRIIASLEAFWFLSLMIRLLKPAKQNVSPYQKKNKKKKKKRLIKMV